MEKSTKPRLVEEKLGNSNSGAAAFMPASAASRDEEEDA